VARREGDWRDAVRRVPGATAVERQLWERRRQRLIEDALGDAGRLQALRSSGSLPSGYGLHFDERVVELPWVMAQRPRGRVLDAGSALNHGWFLDALLPKIDELHIVTLAPEPEAFTQRGVSYAYADLRELPYRDGLFDTIISVSTLEHVGMDNTGYGADVAAEADPDVALAAALQELRRVLAPGGRILVTVPYGRPERHGWLRQFDAAALDRLVGNAAPEQHELSVYRHGERGWQPSGVEDAAAASYGDHKAEAVALLRLEYR
jgi:SAM-dependent methyltransferase